jgi:hypothetical protein
MGEGRWRQHSALEHTVFCSIHTIPHEDCPNCRTIVAAMRPTVFAELAAAELRSGTESCPDCDYVYYEAVARCPQCGEPHPFHPDRRRTPAQAPTMSDLRGRAVADLGALTLRDLAGARESGTPNR